MCTSVFSEPEDTGEKDVDRKEQESTEVTETTMDSTCGKDNSSVKKIPVPEDSNTADKVIIVIKKFPAYISFILGFLPHV